MHRLRSLIAGMAAAMAGIDVLVFTGGVGERSAEVRSLAVEGSGSSGSSSTPSATPMSRQMPRSAHARRPSGRSW